MSSRLATAILISVAGVSAQAGLGLPTEFSAPGALCAVPKDPEPTCFDLNFAQPEKARTGKVDLLFVTQVLRKSQLRPIADGITSIVNELSSDLDLRVASMAASGGEKDDSASGELVTATNEPQVLDFTQMTPDQLWYWFALKLAKTRETGLAARETDADPCSLATALTTEKLERSRQQGFFRGDAALAIVIDPDTSCDAEALLEKLTALQTGRPLLVASLLENAGASARTLVALANGVLADGMSGIGRAIMRKINLETEIALEHSLSLIDLPSLQASVDGQAVDFSVSRATNRVLLTGAAGGNGSRVQISY